MLSRGEGISQPHKKRNRRRVATGVATVALLAGCGSANVDVSMDDLFPRDTSESVEHETDPEMDTHIGAMASTTAESVLYIVRANGVTPTHTLPDGLYYASSPTDRFMISLELIDGQEDLSADNLEELNVTRFYEDETGGTSDSVKFRRSEVDGTWMVRVIEGRDIRTLGVSSPQDDGFDLDAAQVHIDQMLTQFGPAT